MQKLCALLSAVLVLGLSACVTPYAKSGLTGGYDEKELEPGIWRVIFAGNGYTSRETVQTFWLYRCAELTQEKGYDGFEILSNIQLVSLHQSSSQKARVFLTHGGGGGGGTFFYYGGSLAEKPVLTADIRLLKGPVSAKLPKVFDAAALKLQLEPLVKGHLCSGNVCPHVHHYLMAPDAARGS